MSLTAGAYAELLGFYLGDGHVTEMPRTERLRFSLDARHPGVARHVTTLLEQCFAPRSVGRSIADDGGTTVVSVYARHLTCLLPQHGAGKKHERPIVLEPWQTALVEAAPWSLLRGLVLSDGCAFVNRTGRYSYLSYDFTNRSSDIVALFCRTCDRVGVGYTICSDRGTPPCESAGGRASR